LRQMERVAYPKDHSFIEGPHGIAQVAKTEINGVTIGVSYCRNSERGESFSTHVKGNTENLQAFVARRGHMPTEDCVYLGGGEALCYQFLAHGYLAPTKTITEALNEALDDEVNVFLETKTL